MIMEVLLIFGVVISAFICMAFWEAYIEGQNPWAKASAGWKLKFHKDLLITAYHFWLWLFLFLLFSLPLIVCGWNLRLFGVLLSALAIGLVVEDFMWYVINPHFNLKKDWNPKSAYWYPWLKIGKFAVPWLNIIGIAIALLSYFFIWRS